MLLLYPHGLQYMLQLAPHTRQFQQSFPNRTTASMLQTMVANQCRMLKRCICQGIHVISLRRHADNFPHLREILTSMPLHRSSSSCHVRA
jgi:hypothetical protein